MGNTACVPAIISSNTRTKLVRWDGTLSVYSRPVKAADVMVDNPGHFICPATSLQVGHRVSGLVADDELKPQILYFLLPMKLFYSVLTNDEVIHLNGKAHKAAKLASFHSLGRFFPGLGEFRRFPSEGKRTESDGKQHITEPDTSITVFIRQRSWRPALETIVEAY
ncbi:hypothetical protein RDABS01_010609 [Bienertia sinuspersici]